jgi:hypothetical protein
MLKRIFILIFIVIFSTSSVIANEVSNIFVPNISKDQVKNAIVMRAIKTNWQVKSENNYNLSIYRIKDDAASIMLYGSGHNMHPEERVNFTFVSQGNGVFISYNALAVSNPNSGYEKQNPAIFLDSNVKTMLEELFLGKNNYNVNYKIKKDYILISDTPKTIYANNKNRIGKEYKKIIKVNDKNINEYKKVNLKLLFNQCKEKNIKLELEDGSTFILLQNYTLPTYKQYL